MTPRVPGTHLRTVHDAPLDLRQNQSVRYFVGLQLCRETRAIYGALVRVWGRGLLTGCDVVASSCRRDPRIGREFGTEFSPAATIAVHWQAAVELAELAAEAVAPLMERHSTDATLLRTSGLLGFGRWHCDRLGNWGYVPSCDTALLAKLTGLTVIDDFPGRDLAHGGRGGPCEAVGAWMLLADRGLMPGRVNRALIDIAQTSRLFLLPPRQAAQLPVHLHCYQFAPGLSLLNGILERFSADERTFDRLENLAVQGRRLPELLTKWNQLLADEPTNWTPHGCNETPLLQTLNDWPTSLRERLPDVLCTAVVLLAERFEKCVQQLPRSLPVGQLILSGPLQHHPFLNQQIKRRVPEIGVTAMDDQVATTQQWRAPAAALLGMLHVDQVPMNTPALTGTDTPRILGRMTPGSPGNWHRVLGDMAEKLPDKMTLRSAI